MNPHNLVLRKPQHEALTQAHEAFMEGLRRLLIQLPTGVGKTPTFAALRDFFGFKGRVLVLIHMDDLAVQAKDKLQRWNPDEQVGIEMGKSVSDRETFVVASVPTLAREGSRRLLKFDPTEFDVVICDEAHHSVAGTWRTVLSYFGFDDENESKYGTLLLGVTATPNRGDKKGLSALYQKLVYQKSLLDAIKEGWLVVPRAYRIESGQSLEGVRIEIDAELASAIDNKKRNSLVVESYIKYGEGRKAICFTADIEHAKHQAEEFNKAGVSAAAIWGTDPEKDEKKKAHREGLFQVLVNCNVLIEGYDDDTVGCVILGRPTKSKLLFEQMIGRGLRMQFGINNLLEAREAGTLIVKDDCIILDVADNTEAHTLATLPSLFGMPDALDLKGASVLVAEETLAEYAEIYPNIDFSALTDIDLIEIHAHQVDLFQAKLGDDITSVTMLPWFRTADGTIGFVCRPKSTLKYQGHSLVGGWHRARSRVATSSRMAAVSRAWHRVRREHAERPGSRHHRRSKGHDQGF